MNKRFNLEFVVYGNDETTGSAKPTSIKVLKHNVTAGSKLEARRLTLERAWSRGLCIDKFLSIKERVI